MGNVLRALQKSADQARSAGPPVVQTVSLAVARVQAEAQQRLTEPPVEPAAPVEPPPEASQTAAPPEAPAATPAAHARLSPLLVAHHQPHSPAGEQIRQLRTTLLGLTGDAPLRCMLSSARPRDGKTVTACNLALSLAERKHQRTLLIDADLRRGRVAELFDLPDGPGLAEVLSGSVQPDRAIRRTARENLDVLPRGHALPQRIGELLSSQTAEQAVRELMDRYDCVIVDAPPVEALADAGLIGRWVNTTLLAVRLHRTARDRVQEAIRQLTTAGVQVHALVALDSQSAGHRAYHYA